MIPTSKKMNTRTSYVVIAIMAVVGGLSIMPAFGQDLTPRDVANKMVMESIPISVTTDKSVYDHNSMITVQGQIANFRPNSDIGLIVTGPPPFKNVIMVDQIKVNSDGTFKTTISTAGEPWKYDGTYIIRVTYGTQEVTDTVPVDVVGGIIELGKGNCKPKQLAASGVCMDYNINAGRVTHSNIVPGTTSLIINLETDAKGSIEITIPRNILDSKMNGNDDDFIVLIDGNEVSYREIKNIDSRKVTIQFPDGANQIEIIGTYAIPEFGTIAALILAVAIISIIAISAKTRLNVLPKY